MDPQSGQPLGAYRKSPFVIVMPFDLNLVGLFRAANENRSLTVEVVTLGLDRNGEREVKQTTTLSGALLPGVETFVGVDLEDPRRLATHLRLYLMAQQTEVVIPSRNNVVDTSTNYDSVTAYSICSRTNDIEATLTAETSSEALTSNAYGLCYAFVRPTQGAVPAGRAMARPASFVRDVDASSSQLYQAFMQNQELEPFTFVSTATENPWTFAFDHVQLNTFDASDANERITFRYSAVTVTSNNVSTTLDFDTEL